MQTVRMTVRVAVGYYSATGNVHHLAEAVPEGAAAAGAEVRLRRAAELAPSEAVDATPAWRQHSSVGERWSVRVHLGAASRLLGALISVLWNSWAPYA